MRPLAHHAGEDSFLSLLLLGGSWLPVAAVVGRIRLAAARHRLARLLRRERERPEAAIQARTPH